MALLTGTRALITGATSGLGRAMAWAMADSGARVAVTSRDRVRAEASAAEIGGTAMGVELDVRDVASVTRAVDEVYAAFGGLDVLVNNAGIGMRTVNPRFMTEPRPFYEVSPAGFRDVLETKVTGSFLVAREVLPRMLAAGGGRVVTISMNEQTMSRRGFVPYGPSGAAVEALARVMAADLRDTPVRANILLPGGATRTGMLPDDVPAQARGQLLDPSIMGPPIVWLASAQAADVHDERIVASTFQDWIAARRAGAR
jgi:NAD(P)-dependent dehydrogenase (short-subunit alcohol dehydrogenase family)